MTDSFVIRPSQKAGLASEEKFIVTSGDFVWLRILGDGAKYAVVTPTADEDDKEYLVPENRDLMIALGLSTSEALGVTPKICRDNYGRDFVVICEIENDEDASSVVEVFSRLLDEHIQASEQAQAVNPVAGEAQKELRDIYEAIAPDDSGGDAYLGDGAWISRDGGWSDRGR